MNLSEPYSGMDRDPDEQQYIVAEMTEIIKHDPTNAQAYFRRGNAWSNAQRVMYPGDSSVFQPTGQPFTFPYFRQLLPFAHNGRFVAVDQHFSGQRAGVVV